MAMNFAQAGRAENPDLAAALAQQEQEANMLRAAETQADAQTKNSLLTGGAMLASAAPAGTFMSAGIPAAAGAAAVPAAMTPMGWGALGALGLGSLFL